MDFHSLTRRDLQFLCKRNKIPANMTNLAMADSLKSLEIVEGLDEYMNQSESIAPPPHSPTTVAKHQPPNTAIRTTGRKTEASVAKTPAARSTRKASAATSCASEMVQSVYSTRRSTRLLGKCMADLSVKTKPEKSVEVAHEENLDDSEEVEVITGRDLSASMEKESDISKSDNDQVVANIETNKEEVIGDVDESENSLIEETLQAMCAEDSKMNEVVESDNSLIKADKEEEEERLQVMSEEEGSEEKGDLEINVDLGDISVLEYAETETNKDTKESMNVQVQVDQQEREELVQENGSDEADKFNSFDTMVDQTDDDSETKPEEETISVADSNEAVLGSDIADEEMFLSESEGSFAAAEAKATPLSPFSAETISVQFPRPNITTTPSKMVSVDNKENNMEMMMMDVGGECKEEIKKKKNVEIDEENLKDVSMRQLVKMVKELTIKTNNNKRTALQILPTNNM